jgi:hypothetical protein
MARPLKTRGTEGEIRVLSGKIRFLQRKGDYLFPVEIWLLNDLINRNNWRYEDVEGNAKKFVGLPILTAYLNEGKRPADIGDGHNFTYETDENGDPAPSFTGATDERIVGALSDDPADLRVERKDGAVWVVGIGNIFAWYAKELVKKLEEYAEQGREIPVSIETLVSRSRMEGRVEVEEEYEILGVTILGDHVTPAVAGARIAALNSMGNELKELKMRAASYAEQPKTENKGVRTLSAYTKKQCEELQARVNGWRVLAAVEDENGVHIALCDADYNFARCDLANADDPIVTKNFVSCAATLDFGIGEIVDISDVFSGALKVAEELASAKATITERDNQIKAMQDAENKRRVKAAKDVAVATLAAVNKNRREKIADNAIKEICDEIEGGCYTAMTDKEGQWCGDKAVENAVYAVCGKKQREMDDAAAEREKTAYTYSKYADNSNQGGVTGLLEKKGIKD